MLVVLLILLSIGMGSYLKSSVTSNNTQDAGTKDSRSETSPLSKQQANGMDVQKTQMHSKMDQNKIIDQDEAMIDQDYKREDDVIKAKREERIKKTLSQQKALKPNHLYVKSPKEMEKVLLKEAHKRDMEKRFKTFHEKQNVEREL